MDDETADDRTDAETQVQELEIACESQDADLVFLDHHSQQGVPSRPSGRLAEPVHEHGGQGRQHAVHRREAGDAKTLHDVGHEHHFPGTDAVDEGTGQGADWQCKDGDAPDQQARDPESDVPDLV